jgi:ferredoxin, 2Fe-2S
MSIYGEQDAIMVETKSGAAMAKSELSSQQANGGLGPNTVRLTFLPGGQSVEFEAGTLPYQEHGKAQSILDVALNFGVHLEHACGGSCACTTCHVVVKKGGELLSECSEEEADRLDMAADLQLHSRLGCQAVIEKPGEVVVEIPAWNRNYISEGGGSTL